MKFDFLFRVILFTVIELFHVLIKSNCRNKARALWLLYIDKAGVIRLEILRQADADRFNTE